MNKIVLTILLIIIFLSGCATQGISTFRYYDSTPVMVNNELQISNTQSQVWDILIKEISKSFFVINNIDKDSRIINISFSTDSPAKYVDCGKTHRTYTQGDKTEEYDYESAESSVFKIATPNQLHHTLADYILMRRETTLEGRSNIYVAPDEKNNNITVLAVNTRYILNIKVRPELFSKHWSGYIISRGRSPEETSTVTFNTNKPGEIEIDRFRNMTCFSKGTLEKEILDMVQRKGK